MESGGRRRGGFSGYCGCGFEWLGGGGADAEDAHVDLSGADAQHAGEDGAADGGEDVGVADLGGWYWSVDWGREDARDCDGRFFLGSSF